MMMHTLPRLDVLASPQQFPPASNVGALRTNRANLPLYELAFNVEVSGMSIRTTLSQTFCNPFDEAIRATYVFPMEGESAIVACRLLTKNRVTEAVLKERNEARREYNKAISNGYTAALLEEDRSETFSLSLGNLAAGESAMAVIESVGLLPVTHDSDGNMQWTIRLPLVIAPRYTSGIPLPGISAGDGTHCDTDQVPDASRVTPAVRLPGFASGVRLRIHVGLDSACVKDPSEPWSGLRSSLHTVVARADSPGGGCRLETLPDETIDRDFVLRGSLPSEKSVSAHSVVQTGQSHSTCQVDLVAKPSSEGPPRDIAYVLDRSGSMSGWKIQAAVNGIRSLIARLTPRDHFTIHAFDNLIETFSHEFVSATSANVCKADSWVSKIGARGGTEMGIALSTAVEQFQASISSSEEHDRSRSIVLVTDGQITGEDSLLRLLSSVPSFQRPRIFALGVDRCVNASVLTRVANFTDGSFELAESKSRLLEVLELFSQRIGQPAVSDLSVRCEPAIEGVEWARETIPSVYAGTTLSLFARFPSEQKLERIVVTGRRLNGEAWESSVDVKELRNQKPTLLALWGRRRIRDIEDRFVTSHGFDGELQDEIISTSLSTGVLSRLTGFVAVDRSRTVSDQIPQELMVPVCEPEGWYLPKPIPRRFLRSTDFPTSTSPSLLGRQITFDLVELVPESVARENNSVPIGWKDDCLLIAMPDANDIEMIEKLRFILNRRIIAVSAPQGDIEVAINSAYGLVEGESADSMLQEFTDTAIDFCETVDESEDEDIGECFLPMTSTIEVPPSFAGKRRALMRSRDPQMLHRADGKPPARKDRHAVTIKRIVNLLILEAIALNADSIEIRVRNEAVAVFYQIDGKMVEREQIPLPLSESLFGRLRSLATATSETQGEFRGEISMTVGDEVVSAKLCISPAGDERVATLEFEKVAGAAHRS
ncbi:MAG: VIT domain-containing protein [Planctomycetota bacterium]